MKGIYKILCAILLIAILSTLLCFVGFADDENTVVLFNRNFEGSGNIGNFKLVRFNSNTNETFNGGTNSYFKVTPKKDGATSQSDYLEAEMTSTISFTDELGYLVCEFDIGSLNRYISGTRISYSPRKLNADGKDAAASTGALSIKVTDEGNYVISDAKSNVIDLGNDPTEWHHVTVIIDLKQEDLGTSDVYYYLDGAFSAKSNATLIGSDSLTLKNFRFQFFNDNTTSTEQSTCFDNLVISHTKRSEEPAEGSIEKLLADSTLPLNSWGGTAFVEGYKIPDTKSVADVDGELFRNEAEAISALKDGSVMNLYKPFTETHLIDKRITVNTNGLAFKFTSELYLGEYSGSTLVFKEGEATVKWNLGDGTEIEETYTASIIPTFKGDLGNDIFFKIGKDGKNVFYEFHGWSSKEGGEAEELGVVMAGTKTYYKSTSKSNGLFFSKNSDGGFNKHTALSELAALLSESNDSDIYLGNDLTVESTLTIGKSVNFELGGYTLAINSGAILFDIAAGGELAVSGGNVAKTVYTASLIQMRNEGTASFSDVTIDTAGVLATVTAGNISFTDCVINALLGTSQGNVIVIQGTDNPDASENARLSVNGCEINHTASNTNNAIVDARKCAVVRISDSTLTTNKSAMRAATTADVAISSGAINAQSIAQTPSTAIKLATGVRLSVRQDGFALPAGAMIARTAGAYPYKVTDAYAKITFSVGELSSEEYWEKGAIPVCEDEAVILALSKLASADPSMYYTFDTSPVKADTVYTPVLKPMLTLYYSLTVATGISVNIYVPKQGELFSVTAISIEGVDYPLANLYSSFYNGTECYLITYTGTNPDRSAEARSATVKVAIGGVEYQYTYSFSVASYCERLLAEGDGIHGEGSEDFAKALLVYLKNCYEYAGSTATDGYAYLSTVVSQMNGYPNITDSNAVYTDFSLTDGRIFSIRLALGTEPSWVIRFQNHFSGRIRVYTVRENANVLVGEYNVTNGLVDMNECLKITLPVGDLCSDVLITYANGNEILRYNLNTYRSAMEDDALLCELVESLYTYSICTKDYLSK